MSRQPELSYGLTQTVTKRQRNLTAATRILSLATDTRSNLASSQTIQSWHKRENSHTMTPHRPKIRKYWTRVSSSGPVRSTPSATNTSVCFKHCRKRLPDLQCQLQGIAHQSKYICQLKPETQVMFTSSQTSQKIQDKSFWDHFPLQIDPQILLYQ